MKGGTMQLTVDQWVNLGFVVVLGMVMIGMVVAAVGSAASYHYDHPEEDEGHGLERRIK